VPTDGHATERPPTAGGRRMCLLSGAQRRVLCPADGPHLPAQLVPRLPQAAGLGGGAGGHGRLPPRVRRFRAGGECAVHPTHTPSDLLHANTNRTQRGPFGWRAF